MHDIAREMVLRCNKPLRSIAVASASQATSFCKFLWYQPEEPEGLKNFAEKKYVTTEKR